MKEFFKGKIVNVNNLSNRTYSVDVAKDIISNYVKDIYFYLNDLSEGKIDESKKRVIDKIIIDMAKPNPETEQGKEIIFQKIRDEKGNIYGKELITNSIFPIKNDYSFYEIKYTKIGLSEVYYDELRDNVYAITEPNSEGFCLIASGYKEEVFLPIELASKLSNTIEENKKEIIIDKKVYDINYFKVDSFKVDVKPKMIFSNEQVINYAITNEEKANTLDVYNYYTEYEKRKKVKEIVKLLRNMTLCNKIGNNFFIYEENNEKQVKTKR